MAYIPLTIYRELGSIPGDLANYLGARDQLYEVEDPSGKLHYFVDDELPRDSEITDDIIRHTASFALFVDTDDGPEHVATYGSLVDAIEARQAAKVTVVAPQVELEKAGTTWDSITGEAGEDDSDS